MDNKNYEKEISVINTKIIYLEKKFEKYENDTTEKLKNIKEQIEKIEKEIKHENEKIGVKINSINEKLDELIQENVFNKGFIKAFIVIIAIINFLVPIVLKFI